MAAHLGYLYKLTQAARSVPPADLSLSGVSSDGQIFRFYTGDLTPQTTLQIKLGPRTIELEGAQLDVFRRARKTLNNLAKKDSKIKPSALDNFQLEERPMPVLYFTNHSPGKSASGGVNFFRSVLKTAVNYFLYSGGQADQVSIAIRMVREIQDERWWDKARFFYPGPQYPPIHDVGPDEISHMMHLRGDAKNRVLYCYVELFNSHNVLVLLSDYYTGPELTATYCYDIISKQVLPKTVNLPFKNREHVVDPFMVDQDTLSSREEAYRNTRSKLHRLLIAKGFIANIVEDEPGDKSE